MNYVCYVQFYPRTLSCGTFEIVPLKTLWEPLP